MTRITYPHAPRTQGERRFADRRIPDPYGWLADTASAQTRDWLASQDRLIEALIRQPAEFLRAKAYLQSFPPAIPPCRVDASEAAGFMPARYGQREFFLRRDAEGQIVPLCTRSGSDGVAAIRVPEGTTALFPSPSGRFVAFADGLKRSAGIIDLERPGTEAASIGDVCATHICWWPDERGVVINSFAPLALDSARVSSGAEIRNGLYSYDLGLGQAALIVDGEREKSVPAAHPLVPLWIEAGRLWVGVQEYWSQEIRGLLRLDLQARACPTTMIDPGQHELLPVGLTGDCMILLSRESRGYASILAARRDGERARVEELAVLTEGVPVRYIPGKPWGQMSVLLGERIYVACFEHTQSRVRVFDLEGADLGVLPLPAGSGVDGLFACPDTNTLRVAAQSYLHPPATFEFEDQVSIGSAANTVPVSLDTGIEQMLSSCEQVPLSCPSSDGARIPFTLVRAKARRDRSAPLLLNIYGGFGNIWQPAFAADVCLWLAAGGSYVQAHIRGDGVYGKGWHDAAAPQREVAIADIAAVRDFLVAAGYTSADEIVIRGDSNGGLMSLAAMARHPDKFAGVIATMPLADPIAHLFERSYPTLTRDFGDPKRNADDLARILEWAPGYNLSDDIRYPPLFLAVGDRDPVVLAEDSYRLVARLQNLPARDSLALLRVVRGRGHQRWFGDVGRSVSAEMFVFAQIATGQIGDLPSAGSADANAARI